jgi:hypothetical protein
LLLGATLQSRVERKSAKDKVQVVQEALASFKNLFDAGLIDAQEHEKRRAQLLDKVCWFSQSKLSLFSPFFFFIFS